MTNLPNRFDHDTVICDPVHVVGLTKTGFVIRNSAGYAIDNIQGDPNEIAREIARLITEARNLGFEQGRAYVRNALGL